MWDDKKNQKTQKNVYCRIHYKTFESIDITRFYKNV